MDAEVEAGQSYLWWMLGLLAAIGTGYLLITFVFPALCALNRFVCFWVIAALNTFVLFLGSSFLGLGLGFLFGWARATGSPFVNLPSLVYIESFRGIPRIVIVLMAIIIFPRLGSSIDQSVLWGIAALGISSGAYQAEVFRSGFQSISHGQIEAAQSLGMDYWQTMRHVTLPQVIRTILPPLSNEWIIVLKDTSLLVFLTSIPGTFPSVFELLARARYYQTTVFDVRIWPFIFLATALIYLVMTVIISRTFQWAEERYEVPGLGVMPA